MKEKRRFWRIKFTLRILNVTLVCATILTLISFYALVKLITEPQYSLIWRVNLVILQLCFTAVIFVFIISIFLLVHRSMGPLPRMEEILEKVINGDYKQRIKIREKDVMCSFVDKLNKVFSLLEEKGKG